ncbi:MAG TPA: GDP-mannose 4,6-dehydratase [bacterium]|nr:GDP-mannose 4,6-dehydratase [bacterium]HOL67742.1 GDP-mannose 4,6-dehydratase [bacterium]
MRRILLTGAAGFIGAKVGEKLLQAGATVLGLDDLNDYYDVRLKKWRLSQLARFPDFSFRQVDIANRQALHQALEGFSPEAIINLAARAGVRYSLENPYVYFQTNAIGTLNLLEIAREKGIRKFILASTSSLYAGQKMPFSETLPVNEPISPYAASKKAAEVTCYTYHYLYGLDATVFRYFTVYGPCGRPDMSIFRFITWIQENRPLQIFGDGSQSRDFTYVDDIAEGTIRGLNLTGFQIINLGGNQPYTLSQAIALIEKALGKSSKIQHHEFHRADLKATWADISRAKELLQWQPTISLEEGIKRTVQWHIANYDWLKEIQLPV